MPDRFNMPASRRMAISPVNILRPAVGIATGIPALSALRHRGPPMYSVMAVPAIPKR